MALNTRIAVGIVALAASAGLAACGGTGEGSSSGSAKEAATQTLIDFYESLFNDGNRACELLTSGGQRQAVQLLNAPRDPDDHVQACRDATGIPLETTGGEFINRLYGAQEVGQDPSSMSIEVNGSTATVTLDGPDEIYREAILKKFGDTWRVESFVTLDAY